MGVSTRTSKMLFYLFYFFCFTGVLGVSLHIKNNKTQTFLVRLCKLDISELFDQETAELDAPDGNKRKL